MYATLGSPRWWKGGDTFLEPLGRAEIADLEDVVLRVDEDILGLDIAVADSESFLNSNGYLRDRRGRGTFGSCRL